jgi:RNase P/RNase MRP subunit POP5
MVLFRSRYLVLEIVSLGHTLDDSLLTTAVLSSAIHDSLLTNFGEHGLASNLPSLQGERFCYKRGLCACVRACVCGLGFSRVASNKVMATSVCVVGLWQWSTWMEQRDCVWFGAAGSSTAPFGLPSPSSPICTMCQSSSTSLISVVKLHVVVVVVATWRLLSWWLHCSKPPDICSHDNCYC